MLMNIAQQLKTEYNPPTDLTPELRHILRRLNEQKDGVVTVERKGTAGRVRNAPMLG
jgi:hypothetical protein